MTAWRAFALTFVLLLADIAAAHTPASSHVTIDRSGGEIRLIADLAILDLAAMLPVDGDGDQQIIWGELLAVQDAVDQQLLATASLKAAGQECALQREPGAPALVRYGSTEHLSLTYRASCPGETGLSLAFPLFSTLDPGHRVFVRDAGRDTLQVLTVDQPEALIGSAGKPAFSLMREGIDHILEGYDHLLFLLLLVLPAFATPGAKVRLLHLAGIITTFTVAHSVTLGLAAMGLIAVPGKPVEIAIALSIVIAGLLNIWRPRHRIGWKLAGGFGLLHGFGFAGALSEIGFAGSSLVLNLLAFNIGVEIGQLMLVAMALPLLIALGNWSRYAAVVVPATSAAGVALGLVWTLSRI